VADGWAAAAVVVATALLHGSLLLSPATRITHTQFAGTHGWALDRMAALLAGAATWSSWTPAVSFPDVTYVAHIAWVPGLVAAPFNWAFGPVVGLNAATVLSPALAVPVVSALARHWRRATPASAALAGALFALSPQAIGALANGQLCKAQLWAVAIVPLAISLGGRSWTGLLAAPLLAASSVYTEPTYALLGALLVVPVGAWEAWRERRLVVAARLLLAAAAVGAVDLVAKRYYGVATGALYVPAHPVPINWFEHYLLQVATPVTLVTGRAYEARLDLVGHVDYVGPGALAVLAVALVCRGTGRGLVALAAALGLVLALGEWLVTLDGPVRVGGRELALPARALAAVGFPLADSGQYYRALVLAWLAVALAVASARPRVAALLALVLVGDGLRATRNLWPVPAADYSAAHCFTPLSRNPGKVGQRLRRCQQLVEECATWVPIVTEGGSWRLDLPRKPGLYEAGRRELATALDGLPTSDPPAAHFDSRPADFLVSTYAHIEPSALLEQLQRDGVRRVAAWGVLEAGDAALVASMLGAPTCSGGGVSTWDIPLATGAR